MKAVVDVLSEYESMNIKLWIDGEQLRYRGPSDVLTPDVLDTLKQIKKQLMQFLSNRPTRARGYGCAGCGNKIYEAVEVWETREILEPSEFKHEHKPAMRWQCEGCGAVFEIIGGSKGPQPIN